jgi:hypothetical protein
MNPCSASTRTQLNFLTEEVALERNIVLARAELGILCRWSAYIRQGIRGIYVSQNPKRVELSVVHALFSAVSNVILFQNQKLERRVFTGRDTSNNARAFRN